MVNTRRLDHGVAVVTIDRPPLNALSRALLTELAEVVEALTADPAVKAVVVTGAGKAFAAGADITEFSDAVAAKEIGATFRRAFDTLAAFPGPVIAAINGFALGGGLELALACDLRVSADHGRLGAPEVLLGIIPGAGGTQRLARLVGPARAKDLVWSGRQVRAEEAHSIGLVDRVVPAAEVVDNAIEWATSFATGAAAAIALAKRAIDDGLDGPLAAGLDIEAAAFVEVFGTADASIGIAGFLEHGPGKANFTGA